MVREGYEGLVRGNEPVEDTQPRESAVPGVEVKVRDADFVKNLRFGDGALLLDGTGDYPGRRSLKGRHIVRVGWDDVRGWLAEVSAISDRLVELILILTCYQGGTLIGTARSKAFRTPEGRLAAANNMIKEGIDALAVIGGDGSLTGADVFRSEWPKLVEQLHAQGCIHHRTITRSSFS